MEFLQRNGDPSCLLLLRPAVRPYFFRQSQLNVLLRFDTQDALYDVSWSEIHESQLVVAAGDGSLKLFDITLDEFPVQSWQEHKREVFAAHWNLVTKDTFCSSSWDGTVKIV